MEIANERKLIEAMQADAELKHLRQKMILKIAEYKYSYNFNWLDIPIIQLPDDILAMQDIVWQIKPDLIIETGVAHGGSMIFYASILELIGKGMVLGIDIEIREHNRKAMESHPMFKRVSLIEGSSIVEPVVHQVKEFVKNKDTVMVCLDSNHTHEHVLAELELYSPFVTKGSYLVVFDTIIEDMSEYEFPNRPWGKGNNPKTAVWEFVKENDRFMIDKDAENRLLFTVAPDGYLKCIKD
jgi:cephalosporin hydroxylase